ncbi:DUF58 domain-containing protein [Sedimentibacter sp. zth1]|uniref:DUF58 domain-containing protein n=1 Tax=Sedimentibacter sp. zth1 TaxID=2816908 RepID=UPI001A916B67|nr:DUF58 domain-containing protein [Sedimentibacter sp. zth1]QSX04893.1 DUF58 domain-containing protein [Sedimentibacter sp. zth1]
MGKFIFVLIFLAFVVEQISLIIKLDKIQYSCKPSVRSAEVSEMFEINSLLSNHGLIFIPNLEITEKLPENISINNSDKLSILKNKDSVELTTAIFIRRRELIRRKMKVSINKRGVYAFKGCTIYSSDFLGFYKPNREIEQNKNIIIYPKLLENKKLLIALSNFYGDFLVNRMLIRDPILVLGYHDYTGLEPLKSISWNQTAKRNSPIVKEYDYTQEQSVTVVLDITYKNDFGKSHENLETCFAMTRTVCQFLEQKKVAYNLITNACIINRDKNISNINSSGQGNKNFINILELLGSCTYFPVCTIEIFFDYLNNSTMKNSGSNNSIIYISCSQDDKTLIHLNYLKNKRNINVYPLYANNYCEEDTIHVS